MQLVIHSPYGSRINRAWGLALRKRFCRKFNFELQAAATEDNIVLSLTTAHSFELGEVARYLHSASVRPLLIQALLDAPMFITRWRWVIGVALALPRFRGGRKVAPQLARMGAEDLIAAVFPDQIACAENLVGEREIPDHPLVRQTIADCLNEAMDIVGLERLLGGIESGDIRDRRPRPDEPSPLALEVLSARPYAYLDDAPLEERRTQAVMSRRWLSPETASELGRLDAEADCARSLRSLARSRQRRRAARRAGLARLPHRRRKRRRSRVGATGCRSWRAPEAGRATRARRAQSFGYPRSACRSSRRCGRGQSSSRRSLRRALLQEARNGRAMRRWSRSCADGSKGSGPVTQDALAALDRGWRRARSPPRCRRSRPKALPCAGGSRPGSAARSGASAGCSPAFITTRSSACAPRSSRSQPAISCASCWPGSASRRTRAWRAPPPSKPWSASSKVSRRRPAPGKPRSCPRGSPATSRPGSTIAASRDMWRGCGCDLATGGRTAATAAPRRCAPRLSRSWRVVMPPCGHRCSDSGRCAAT